MPNLKTAKRLAFVFMIGTCTLALHSRSVRASMDTCGDLGSSPDEEDYELLDCGTCSDQWCIDGEAQSACTDYCFETTGFPDGEMGWYCDSGFDTNCMEDCLCPDRVD